MRHYFIYSSIFFMLMGCELSQQGTIDLTKTTNQIDIIDSIDVGSIDNIKKTNNTDNFNINQNKNNQLITNTNPNTNINTIPKTTLTKINTTNKGVSEWKKQVTFDDIPNWSQENYLQSIPPLLKSCQVLASVAKYKAKWVHICAKAQEINTNEQAKEFYEAYFTPYSIISSTSENTNNPNNKQERQLLTGYYEPLLYGNRTKTEQASTPLCKEPDDLITIDLSSLVNPNDKQASEKPENIVFARKLKGRLISDSQTKKYKVVAYPNREEITKQNLCQPLVWVNDPIDAFFLEIQGSGRVQFDDGEIMRVGYANQNGRSYQSIGQYLIQKGELESSKASMQGIKNWVKQNPYRLQEVLNQNPSVVFFRELSTLGGEAQKSLGPLGALNVPLTPERSIAVDLRYHELGTPMFIKSTFQGKDLTRLMMAQDTGGAIRGSVRGDFFWGFGDEAGKKAGTMKQPLELWTLEPKTLEPKTLEPKQN